MKISRALDLCLVREKMVEKGLSQDDVAKGLAVDSRTAHEWITGKQNPIWINVIRLAKFLDIPSADILLHNPHRLLDLQDKVYEMVFDWIEEVLRTDDPGKLERIELASNILQRHFAKVDLNDLKEFVKAEQEVEESQIPKMTKEEALDL